MYIGVRSRCQVNILFPFHECCVIANMPHSDRARLGVIMSFARGELGFCRWSSRAQGKFHSDNATESSCVNHMSYQNPGRILRTRANTHIPILKARRTNRWPPHVRLTPRPWRQCLENSLRIRAVLGSGFGLWDFMCAILYTIGVVLLRFNKEVHHIS
jgi:hypothetical protein